MIMRRLRRLHAASILFRWRERGNVSFESKQCRFADSQKGAKDEIKIVL